MAAGIDRQYLSAWKQAATHAGDSEPVQIWTQDGTYGGLDSGPLEKMMQFRWINWNN